MHQIYAHPLGLLLKPNGLRNSADTTTTPHTLLNSDEVVVFTTRYRRTFQSALALLFALLPADKWLALNVRESHSMAFCFGDCSCAQSVVLQKRLVSLADRQLLRRSDVLAVMQWIGGTLLQHTANEGGITNPFEVVDAMLTVLCHDASLPCRRRNASQTMTSTRANNNNQDLVDVINIDQDETATNQMQDGLAAAEPQMDPDPETSSDGDTEGVVSMLPMWRPSCPLRMSFPNAPLVTHTTSDRDYCAPTA